VGQEFSPKDPTWREDDAPQPPSWRDNKVHKWRFDEARRLGLTFADAHLFASKPALDLNGLRRLAARGCPPHLLLHLLDED
jgi:hypothetical protein